MPVYTQIFAHSDRTTQTLAAVKGLDAYIFSPVARGALICERTSEALDVRITIQVAEGISSSLGRGHAVLAIAGDKGTGFWCKLFDNGVSRFEHNRLVGQWAFGEEAASLAEVDVLCSYFGADSNTEAVYSILTSHRYESAIDRHVDLAGLLELPVWSPGLGYSRVISGDVPPKAGQPIKPPRSAAELRSVDTVPEDLEPSDPLAKFQQRCRRAFNFLEEEFGFWIEPSREGRPDYQNPYTLCYRNENLIIVIEGLSYGGRTRLCLIDRDGQDLDFTGLVELRTPELLDLCRLADGQREQIPLFAEALRTCAADILEGALNATSPAGFDHSFSFDQFYQRSDRDYVLAHHGPSDKPSTIWARIRRARYLHKIGIRLKLWS